MYGLKDSSESWYHCCPYFMWKFLYWLQMMRMTHHWKAH
jgi:hypothetical protein